jgi:hypothetical protein
MAAGAWTFTNGGRSDILGAVVNIGTDSYKMALVTNAGNISASTTTWAGVTGEVGTTNTGYTTGGNAVTLSKSGTTTVTVVQSAGIVWTAGTANLTAKWAVIYEVSGNVLCYATLDSGGADVTATSGNTMTVGGTSATVFTLA